MIQKYLLGVIFMMCVSAVNDGCKMSVSLLQIRDILLENYKDFIRISQDEKADKKYFA